MSVYAEVKIVNSDGDRIGVFKLDMPEQAIGGGEEPAQIQRFVTDPANGKVYMVGVAATVAGLAAAEEVPARDDGGPIPAGFTQVHPVARAAEFNVGDKAIVTVDNSPFVSGDTVTILEPLDWDGHYWCEGRGGQRRYVDHSQLCPAPEVPVAEFKVGDWVRFTDEATVRATGSLGRVMDTPDADDDYKIDYGPDWYYFSAEDIEPAGDFRVGDKVRIVTQSMHYIPVGTIAEVVDTDTDGDTIVVCGKTDNGFCADQNVYLDDAEYTFD